MKRIFFLSTFLLCLSVNCLAQKLGIEQLKAGYSEGCIRRCQQLDQIRDFGFRALDSSFFKSDTLIVIESRNFSYNYSCAVYPSAPLDSISRIFNYYELEYDYFGDEFDNRVKEIKIIPFEGEYFSIRDSFIIKSIQNNRIEDVLERGSKPQFLPVSILMITVAIKNNDEYTVVSYQVYDFSLQKMAKP